MENVQQDEAIGPDVRGSAVRVDLTVDTTADPTVVDGSNKGTLATPGTVASTPGTNFSGTNFSFPGESSGSNEVERSGDPLPGLTISFIEQILASVNEPLPDYTQDASNAIREDESNIANLPSGRTEDERTVTVGTRKESLVDSRIKLSVINKYYTPSNGAD